MIANDKNMSGQESLDLIRQMINRAKDSYHSTGVGAIMWGTVIAICSLVKLAEIHFDFRLPFDIYLLTLAAIIPQLILTAKERKERKVKSYDDSYMNYIWLGFGICIFLLTLINKNVFAGLNPMVADYKELAKGTANLVEFRYSEYVSSLFLLLYGLPTFITGAACKFKPMLFGGLFCWVCCVIALYTNMKVDLALTALSAIMAWLIPGVLMEKEYRRYKKEQAANV